MNQAELKKYMETYPEKTQVEVANFFGVTKQRVSQIISKGRCREWQGNKNRNKSVINKGGRMVTCLRCNYSWATLMKTPHYCPYCHSQSWDMDYGYGNYCNCGPERKRQWRKLNNEVNNE